MRKKKIPLQQLWESCGNAVSGLIGRLARARLPASLLRPLLRAYVRHYQVDMALATRPLEAYSSFDGFFTREVKPDLRPIESDLQSAVSPVDGRIHNFGDIHEGVLLQAKGVAYPLESLLADAAMAARFKDGSFATIYLSPSDCHHVFSPEGGEVVSAAHLPGTLFPVREPFASGLPNLYARNERAVVTLQTPLGLVAVVLVGALNVGNLELSFDREICKSRLQLSQRRYTDVRTQRGAKLGTFHLGSTVVLLYTDRIRWNPALAGSQVCYGEALGQRIQVLDLWL